METAVHPKESEQSSNVNLLKEYASLMVAEAEHEALIRRFAKLRRLNTTLQSELKQVQGRLSEIQQQRDLLVDKVYEKELAHLEFTSGSEDEEDTIPDALLTGEELFLRKNGKLTNEDGNVNLSDELLAVDFSEGEDEDAVIPPPSRPVSSPKDVINISSRIRSVTPAKRAASEESISINNNEITGEEEDEEESTGKGRKKKRIVKSAEAAAATPRKVASYPIDSEGKAILPLVVGVVTLHSTGDVIFDRPAFHNKRYIWPVGYHSSRPYLSAMNPEGTTNYHSCILDGGNGPIFDVYAEDNPDQHFQAPTPTGAWTSIVKAVNAARGRDYVNSASGPDFFGLSNSTISLIIERLPNAHLCQQYQKKVFEQGATKLISNANANIKPKQSSLSSSALPTAETEVDFE